MSELFVYRAEAQLDDGSAVLLDLEQRWADKALLARTQRWSLVPKDEASTFGGLPYPIVSVTIPPHGRPVFKSRVFGTIGVDGSNARPMFRCYAIGYKLGRKTHWLWVLPTGDIELGDDPWLADLLLARLKGAA